MSTYKNNNKFTDINNNNKIMDVVSFDNILSNILISTYKKVMFL